MNLYQEVALSIKKVGDPWSRAVGVGKNYFFKIRLRVDPLLADCNCLCHKKVRKRHTLHFYTRT